MHLSIFDIDNKYCQEVIGAYLKKKQIGTKKEPQDVQQKNENEKRLVTSEEIKEFRFLCHLIESIGER